MASWCNLKAMVLLRLSFLALSLILLATPASASKERRERCANDPLSIGCMTLGLGGSLGVNNDNNVSVGIGARFGVFVAPHVSVSLLPGYLRSGKYNQYDWGMSADGYIPMGDSAMLVPGYYGGLFWLRGPFDGWGTVHGPHVALLFRLGKHVFAGIHGAYTWTNLKGPVKAERDITISPVLTAAF